MKIGIIREGKVPPDSRVALTPKQCRDIIDNHNVEVCVKPAFGRCYTNAEYEAENIPMTNDLRDCDILMGVKEVPINQLIPHKTYFFFSHTIKKQKYNRKLLQACVERDIKLIDYEVLVDDNGSRLIAFGKFAGMVGAHNGLMTYGWRTGDFDLPRMNSFHDYAAAKERYAQTEFPPVKIVLTGTGRVSSGAALVLNDMGIKQVSPEDFLNNDYDEAVYTQLSCQDYVARKDGETFENEHFYGNPKEYKSIFAPYTKVANLMINGIYWDNDAPAFFTQEEMASPNFRVRVIADVTCDIAPVSSIPSTLKASTIADPIFGYNPKKGTETTPHREGVIDMMTIDNLPNELPRDASLNFGEQFIGNILNELKNPESAVISRATITQNRDLTPKFEYLRDYLNGEE